MIEPGAVVALLAGLLSWAAASLVLRHAVPLGLVQQAGNRSSHVGTKPTGGGIGIVLGGTLASAFAAWQHPGPLAVIVAGSLLMAALGLADDLRQLRARTKLAAQVAIFGTIAALSLPELQVATGLQVPEVLLIAIACLAGVYWTNLFNFMDGIDGLAGAQALFMTGAAALLMLMGEASALAGTHFWLLLGLATASAGFLLLNWPPSKIFMGDSGSLYLGFLIAGLALLTAAGGALSLWQWVILAAAFLTDGTVTLLVRLSRRERVFEAHRRHAYQFLARRFGSHQRVTMGFIAINLFWLAPLAYLAGALRELAWLAMIAAYLPLVLGAVWAGAGSPER